MSKRGRIRLVGAAPGTGKSTVAAELKKLYLKSQTPTIVLEHEDTFTPEQRCSAAETAGIALNSKDFVYGFNLPAQIGFQSMLRKIADQGVDVVGFGPFENVTAEVDTLPLYRKMCDKDFAEYDFNLRYLVIDPEDVLAKGVDLELVDLSAAEDEVQRRLLSRQGKSGWQKKLDADKVGDPNYYRKRVTNIMRSASHFGLDVIRMKPDQSPEHVAKILAATLFPN